MLERIGRFYPSIDKQESRDVLLNAMLNMIKANDHLFVPPISERVSHEGYLDYLLGVNGEYIKKKYGKETPLPQNPFTIYIPDPSNEPSNNFSLLGFISCFEYFQPFDGAYIVAIMVSPELHGNGIGTKLLSEALTELNRSVVNSISVTTWSTNARSRRLFSRFGFKLEKIVPNERGPNIDGLYFKLQP